MRIEKDVDLSNYTSFRMGCVAHNLLVPENEDDMILLANSNKTQFCIGGGSNILIKTDTSIDTVVNLREFNKNIISKGYGVFEVGASVRLQDLILEINANGFGGIEYLFSVPGLVGGAIIMNAGRGKSFNKCISDYIEQVKVYKNGVVEWLDRSSCAFEYRCSKLKNEQYIVLSAVFKFPHKKSEETEKLRKERIESCKGVQDSSAPNFGTVFCESNPRIMNCFKKSKILRSHGKISFSSKTANWMLNEGGTPEDAMILIKRVQHVHRIFFQKFKLEVIIW